MYVCSGAEVISNRMYKVWLHIDWIYKLTDMYKLELKHMINGIFQVGNKILDDKLAMLEGSEDFEEPSDEFEYKTPQIFIDQLLRYRNVLTKDEITDEINTFLGAVSLLFSWRTLYNNNSIISKNPRWF